MMPGPGSNHRIILVALDRRADRGPPAGPRLAGARHAPSGGHSEHVSGLACASGAGECSRPQMSQSWLALASSFSLWFLAPRTPAAPETHVVPRRASISPGSQSFTRRRGDLRHGGGGGGALSFQVTSPRPSSAAPARRREGCAS